MTTERMDVLLVEDDPGDVELTREALKNGKVAINLHVVNDGVQALQYLRRQGPFASEPAPDLVLLDLNLPKKDGREVLADMKADAALRMIPVVVLTTSDADADVVNSYGLGVNCYVTKPVDFKQFTRVVRSIEEFWFSVVKLPPRS